jgi:hypothetical protein
VGGDWYNEPDVILHYDGASWTTMDNGAWPALYGLWGTSGSDVFAAGGSVVLHYDGAAWSPSLTSPSSRLFSIWGDSDSDIFAVGSGGEVQRYGPCSDDDDDNDNDDNDDNDDAADDDATPLRSTSENTNSGCGC